MAKKRISQEEDLFNQAVGRHVEALRKRAALTQRRLAKDLNISQQKMAAIECGRSRCSMYMLARIARRFGIPVAALVRNTTLGCIPVDASCAVQKIV
jgi:DNA-binding XRE family transcriptional regulator